MFSAKLSTYLSEIFLISPPPHPKRVEQVFTNFSPFLSPNSMILQNRHQVLWLIFWLNYCLICHKFHHNLYQHIRWLPKIITEFGEKFSTIFPAIPSLKKNSPRLSGYLSPNLVIHKNHHQIWWKNPTLLITKHPNVPSSHGIPWAVWFRAVVGTWTLVHSPFIGSLDLLAHMTPPPMMEP